MHRASYGARAQSFQVISRAGSAPSTPRYSPNRKPSNPVPLRSCSGLIGYIIDLCWVNAVSSPPSLPQEMKGGAGSSPLISGLVPLATSVHHLVTQGLPKGHLINITKDTECSFHLGNSEGFRSSVPGTGSKTKRVFLLISHNIRPGHASGEYYGLKGGFPGGSESKESACNAGDLGLIPRVGRSPGGGHGNPLQYSCLENSMDGGAWWGRKESDTTERLQCQCQCRPASSKLLLLIHTATAYFFQTFSPSLFFFLMWTTFKVFTEFVTVVLLFYVLVFWPPGMWDPD